MCTQRGFVCASKKFEIVKQFLQEFFIVDYLSTIIKRHIDINKTYLERERERERERYLQTDAIP